MAGRRLILPRDVENAVLTVDGKDVRLTNLRKVFWREPGLTKGDLLQYYADVAGVLLPHLRDRAMVMKRYPHGAAGEFFFMKRAPSPRPPWIDTCRIDHGHDNIIDFPMVQDRATLLWVVNLGCIDLNQWYARCDDVDRPDYLHFDLDPGVGATFDHVRETALVVREALDTLKMPSVVKTTGSKGLHVYVPIVRGPEQKQVWTFAKALAQELAVRHPTLITAEYRVAKRPRGRVLVDYNQNRWGQHAGVDLFGPPQARRERLDARDVERSRAGHPHRRFHDAERSAAHRRGRRPVEAAAERSRSRGSQALFLDIRTETPELTGVSCVLTGLSEYMCADMCLSLLSYK